MARAFLLIADNHTLKYDTFGSKNKIWPKPYITHYTFIIHPGKLPDHNLIHRVTRFNFSMVNGKFLFRINAALTRPDFPTPLPSALTSSCRID